MPRVAKYDVLEVQRLRKKGKLYTQICEELGYNYSAFIVWKHRNIKEVPRLERKLKSE